MVMRSSIWSSANDGPASGASLPALADQLPPLAATKEMVRAMIRAGINHRKDDDGRIGDPGG